VDRALGRARASGASDIDLANLLKIGKYLIRFQQQARSPGVAATAPAPGSPSFDAARSRPAPRLADRVSNDAPAPDREPGAPRSEIRGDISGLVRVPPPDQRREVVHGSAPRASEQPAAQGVPDVRPANSNAVDAEAVPATTADAQPAVPEEVVESPPGQSEDQVDLELPRQPRALRLVIGALVLVGAVLAGRALLRKPTEARPKSGGTAATVRPETPLPSLGLQARLPDGWRHAATADGTIAMGAGRPPVPVSVVHRDGQARTDLLLATLPLTGLGNEEALLATAERGHAGGAALLQGQLVHVESDRCRMAAIGGKRAALCIGRAVRAGHSAALRTYLLVGRAHALLALLLDRSSDGARAAEADAIVASLSER
jgi:hypothetical protein